MTEQEFKELEDDGYNGEYTATVKADNKPDSDKVYHITGFINWDIQTQELATMTEETEVHFTELFSESEWGRSHVCCGEVQPIKIKNLKRAYLFDVFNLKKSTQNLIQEELG